MVIEPRDIIKKHALASQKYLENALLILNKGEAAKASELLWGSVAQALQAVAATRDILLSNHRSLRWFVSTLSKELNDRTLSEGFRQAEFLHSNFHEVELTTEDVGETVDPVRTTVSKLLSLIPKELISEEPAQSI